MGDEEIAEYALALRELKVNSKPVITSLTMLAGEIAGGDAGAAATVAGMVERHIRTAAPKTKLTGFYLLDSISKNVKGHFVACFARNLPDPRASRPSVLARVAREPVKSGDARRAISPRLGGFSFIRCREGEPSGSVRSSTLGFRA